MIISENKKPSISIFQDLMLNTDKLLNEDAQNREDYYTKRSGKLLEKDVFDAITECAKGTEFEGTIQLVSGSSFPDIIAKKYYGVEVKSTDKNHWTSIGSSILESTRISDVERIYLTFGKLGKPVRFLSRPYEDCLSGIAVTHYPRYQIDMRLKSGETIFDKMGITYNELRAMDNPVAPVSIYYKGKLKQGESLWWAADDVEASAPPTIRLWTSLTHNDKEELTVKGYALFPEILSACNNKKYNRYALWLASQQGIVNANVRDSFSAGGQVTMQTKCGVEVKMPAAFGRIKKYYQLIEETIEESEPEVLMEYWQIDELYKNRMRQWCQLVAKEADSNVGYETAWNVLSTIFYDINDEDPVKCEVDFDSAHYNMVAESRDEYKTRPHEEYSVFISPGANVRHSKCGVGRVMMLGVNFQKAHRLIKIPYIDDNIDIEFSTEKAIVHHERLGDGEVVAIFVAFGDKIIPLSYLEDFIKGKVMIE